MLLLLVYLVFVIVGESGAVGLGLYLDHAAPTLSIPIALALFFSVLAAGWPLAVYVTERWLIRKPT
jgi:hypothetical protein